MTRRAGVGTTMRLAGGLVLPTLAVGVIKRRPRAMAVAEWCRLDAHAVRALSRLRQRHGAEPLKLALPGPPTVLLLDPADVERVLLRTPSPFSPAARVKRAALTHFQPHAVLTTPMPERAPRRRYNEAVLEADRPEHSLSDRVRVVVREETSALLDGRLEVDWAAFSVAWWRIVRRIVLGDSARYDNEITDGLDSLRLRANWAFLAPKARGRRRAVQERLSTYVDRGEPGSLAGIMARRPAEPGIHPAGQVPHWLFAFDAAGMVAARALAVLATRPEQARTARAEARSARPAGTDGAALPYLRACVLETVRLWPTTPLVLRESTTTTSWNGDPLPPGTLFAVFAPYFHRDPDLVPFADAFAPDTWLDGTVRDFPALVPFSSGPGECPGENLVLLVTSVLLAELLRAGDYGLLAPRALRNGGHPDGRLPPTVNDFAIRLTFTPREPSPYEARGRSA